MGSGGASPGGCGGGGAGDAGKKMMHHCHICNRGFLNKSNIKVSPRDMFLMFSSLFFL